MNLGGRVLKTTAAVGIAVFISQQLGIENVSFAGIVAILSVQRSLFSSVFQAYKKIGSVIVGTGIGAIFAFTFGQNPLAAAVTIFLIIQISLKFHWEDNIVLMTVTALNLMLIPTGGEFFFSARNQLLLALIGSLSGISLNILFSPYHKKEVEELLFFADKEQRELLSIVLQDMKGPEKYDKVKFKDRLNILKEKIEDGSKLAKLLQEEQKYRFVEDTPSERYRKAFTVFASQADRIGDLASLAAKVDCCVPQVFPLVKMGRIIMKIQERVLTGKYVHQLLFEKTIEKLEKDFAKTPLPATREEFISRAALLHIFSELKKYYRRVRQLPSFKV